MYTKSADFYDNLYCFKNYVEEARAITALIEQHRPGTKTVLELACGTGLFMEQFAQSYSIFGLDSSPAMLAAARQRLPGIQLSEGDMTKFNLCSKFDAILCLFGSIAYVQTLERLHQTFACIAKHLATGGLVVIQPYLTPEKYWPVHIVHNVSDRPDLKVSWMYRHNKVGTIAIHDIHYMVGTANRIEHFEEQHTLGLFSEADLKGACTQAGLSFGTEELFPGKVVHIAFKI